MDGTKRTAFSAALFLLESCGYSLPTRYPLDEVIDFCVSVSEENLRQSRGEDIAPLSIGDRRMVSRVVMRLAISPMRIGLFANTISLSYASRLVM
jgi:hypothetical protein